MYDRLLLKSKSCDKNVFGAFQELQYALCVCLTTGVGVRVHTPYITVQTADTVISVLACIEKRIVS